MRIETLAALLFGHWARLVPMPKSHPDLIQTLKNDSRPPCIDAVIALSRIGSGAYEKLSLPSLRD